MAQSGGQEEVRQDNLPTGEELLDSIELMAGLHQSLIISHRQWPLSSPALPLSDRQQAPTLVTEFETIQPVQHKPPSTSKQ